LTLDTKEVTTYRARFPKPVNLYVALSVFGINIVASEGEEWKKYRKIAAPAFSEVRFEIGFRLSGLNATRETIH
jgi:cytochrome P450